MRAGVARSPATTSARSVPPAIDERSTMRYCTVLESGMRAFGHQALDQAAHARVAPIAPAEDRIAHAPLRVDDERHRQAADVPAARDLLLRVEHHRQRHHLALEELRHFFARF